MTLEATEIIPRLYQGSRPPLGGAVSAEKFSAVVLAAKEFQPPSQLFQGVRVIYVPLEDTRLMPHDFLAAQRASQLAIEAYLTGGKVLVTCLAGINRSGLVTALVLHGLTGMSGSDAVKLIRRRRPIALLNRSYLQALRSLPSRERPKGRALH